MAGSTGVLVPPRGYLQRLRSLCDKHDLLLIFDEVGRGGVELDRRLRTAHASLTEISLCDAAALVSGVERFSLSMIGDHGLRAAGGRPLRGGSLAAR